MKGKGVGIHLHLGQRVWGVMVCFVGVIFLAGCYNYSYNHGSPSTRRTMDAQRNWFLNRIPDYHPKKNTNGTHKAQNAEKRLKQQISNHGQ